MLKHTRKMSACIFIVSMKAIIALKVSQEQPLIFENFEI